jgi:hypothetical protein
MGRDDEGESVATGVSTVMNSMEQNEKQHSESLHPREPFIVGFWGVRYQVKDVQRAIAFYTLSLWHLPEVTRPCFPEMTHRLC